MAIIDLTPGLLMILGAVAVPFIPHHFRQIAMLCAIALSAMSLSAGAGIHWTIPLLGQELILHHADNLTFPFGVIFHLAAALNVIYGWHERKSMEHTAGLAYAGAAIAAVHAGDLLSLFIWWEATAVTSVFLIFAAGGERAKNAAMRYLLVQVASGVLLLAGAAFLWQETGSWRFGAMELGSVGTWCIFLAFGVKAAFPFLNGWLQDAYPEATVIGTVMLSAFTTKLAVYAFARGFAGTPELIWIGAAMTAFPVFFAVIENDLRRVLSFSLNNQLGFMIVAIGIGTELAINGAVAHAFAHIIYKSLLFMSMGAVLYRVGTVKASELGGLYRCMPMTMVFCIIGAMSISAFPLFSGFVAKALIMSAIGHEHLVVIYMILLAASAGVLEHSGIKIPYFTFFAHDGGHNVKEAPVNMLIAMGVASILCIGIGVMPQMYYQILPFAMEYQPYDGSHVVGQLQLLIFAMLAFVFLVRAGFYPPEIPSTVLNADWLYRRLAPMVLGPVLRLGLSIASRLDGIVIETASSLIAGARRIVHHPIAGPVIPGPAALIQLCLLTLLLAVIYVALG
jgi:multicomponent Na+:H+ antiporter subunit D